jgi:hypothetical protein
MLDDASVLAIVEPILRKALGLADASTLTIESAFDYYGDSIIRATVHHAPNAPEFDAKAFLDAVNEAMRQLHDRGDDRFLHVRNLYADGEPAVDDEPKPLRRRRRA